MFSVYTWEESWSMGLHPQFKTITRNVSRSRGGATSRREVNGDCAMDYPRIPKCVYKKHLKKCRYIYI